jgi:sugar phosphate isomerase/epimerase
MDTAHLLLEGGSPADFARRYGGRISEVHLNGTRGGSGHKPVYSCDQWFLELSPFLRGFSGIINIELFSWDEVQQSIDSLKDCLTKNV